MWIKTTCRLELDYHFATPIILMLRPRSGAGQWISEESYDFSRRVDAVEYTDQYGNLCQKLVVPPDGFVIETSAIVQTAEFMDIGREDSFVPVMALPEDVLQFLLPSRYCESDYFGEQALGIAGQEVSAYQQIENIVAWIKGQVRYAPGTSNKPCTASEIVNSGQGVCKDLAHLGIAMARSISIPARFVVGYLHGLEPMDLHAWFEVYVGSRWYTFDATQKNLTGARVAIAYGRDAADVAIYHQFGAPARYTDMKVAVTPLNRD